MDHKMGSKTSRYIYCCLVTQSCDPWTIAYRASLSVGFSRQEYWSRLPFPSPGDLPDLGTIPTSPALGGRFFITQTPEKP